MKYYPVYLNVQHQSCLVVGAGAVGTRKIHTLLSFDANITAVSLKATDSIHQLALEKRIILKLRSYRTSDLENMLLVFGTTDNESLNRKIYSDAKNLGKLCNIADQPDLCTFILPSVVQRGDLILAISTSGKSPAYAKRIKQQLEKQFGPEYGEFLKLMGSIRKKMLMKHHDPDAHRSLFEQLIDHGLLDLVRNGDKYLIDQLLTSVLGQDFHYDLLTD